MLIIINHNKFNDGCYIIRKKTCKLSLERVTYPGSFNAAGGQPEGWAQEH